MKKIVIFFVFITFLSNSFLYGDECYIDTYISEFQEIKYDEYKGVYSICFSLDLIYNGNDCKPIKMVYGCGMNSSENISENQIEYLNYIITCLEIDKPVDSCKFCIDDICDYYPLPDYIFWKDQIDMINIVLIGKNSVQIELPYIDIISYPPNYGNNEEYFNAFIDMNYSIYINKNYIDTYYKNDENYLIDQLEPGIEYNLRIEVMGIYGEIMELETTFTTLPEEL